MVTWTDVVQAVGAVLMPVLVAVIAFVLTRRQNRTGELITARLHYYEKLVPDLNDLMCYFTFIGGWRDASPPQVIALKRRLDKNFYCAVPLFSPAVADAYELLMSLCFRTFNNWGQDALMLTSAYRRRPGFHTWQPEWDAMFAYSDDHTIPAEELSQIRSRYDALIVSMVDDINITDSRGAYTTDLVSLNAHAPRRGTIEGAP